MPNQHAFLERFPKACEIKVAWGDMDALQHVNNTLYFKYFEIARIDFLNQAGILEHLAAEQVGPVLADNYAKYKRPVTFPDTLLIGVSISDIGSSSFTTHYSVFSCAQQAVVTEGQAKLVMFDFKTMQKAPLNDSLLSFLHLNLKG
ncbi:thioesterase family protein [Pseudoalteromonas sp. BDTF-M6]|uniref:acyl-CoA thioesterase n=1 Tax=Pseudoalteromonas sp. BDTF-M6 TaxID=2796132 RepID=UPI001BAF9FF2|nr:thioesterase family protein [Pseudoalteromonas sp. BDTF-M6]MBS3798343.1 acyl-CoA thioesterase [Pseudoalteromonas sp. BDTF-M6]